jgi:hypothetical protein
MLHEMMLQFPPDQLMLLQNALSVTHSQPPPQIITPFLVQSEKPSKEVSHEWKICFPLKTLLMSYVIFGLLGCLSASFQGELAQQCKRACLWAIGCVLVLHAATSNKKFLLIFAASLTVSVHWLQRDQRILNLWFVMLSLFFTFLATQRTRLLSLMGAACCVLIFVFKEVSPLPFHIRVGGTLCALAIGGVAACADLGAGTMRISVRTVMV